MAGAGAANATGKAAYAAAEPDAPKFCSITDPTCEACQ
jgi:hypothetical protein